MARIFTLALAGATALTLCIVFLFNGSEQSDDSNRTSDSGLSAADAGRLGSGSIRVEAQSSPGEVNVEVAVDRRSQAAGESTREVVEPAEAPSIAPEVARLHDAFRIPMLEAQITSVLNTGLPRESRLTSAAFLLSEQIAVDLERQGLGLTPEEAEQRSLKMTFMKDGRIYSFEEGTFPQWDQVRQFRVQWQEEEAESLLLAISEAAAKHASAIESGTWREGF